MRFHEFDTDKGLMHVDLDAVVMVSRGRPLSADTIITLPGATLTVRMPPADVLALLQTEQQRPAPTPPDTCEEELAAAKRAREAHWRDMSECLKPRREQEKALERIRKEGPQGPIREEFKRLEGSDLSVDQVEQMLSAARLDEVKRLETWINAMGTPTRALFERHIDWRRETIRKGEA